MENKNLHIAAGIILNPELTKVFITQRAPKDQITGFWEFAGGKVEKGESARDAVIRELDEEVGIEVIELELLISFEHEYPNKALMFDFFLINAFKGEPFGKEGQPGMWVSFSQLEQFEFPEANKPVLSKIMALFGKAP